MSRASFDDLVRRLRLSGLLRTAEAVDRGADEFRADRKARARARARGRARRRRGVRADRHGTARSTRRGRARQRRPQHGSALVGAARRVRAGTRRWATQGSLRLRPVVPRRGPHVARVGGTAGHLPVLQLHLELRAQPQALRVAQGRESVESHDPRRAEHTEVRSRTARTTSSRTRTSTSRFAARAKPPLPRSSTRSTPTTSATSRRSTMSPD